MIPTRGAMNITANTPRPKPPKRERRSSLTWIFFLLILARPLWGILRSTIGAQISDTQLWILVVGVVALGFVGLLATRGVGNRGADARLPTRIEPAQPLNPSRLPGGVRSSYPLGPPRYEPIITGKVALAGFVLAALMVAAGLLLWLG